LSEAVGSTKAVVGSGGLQPNDGIVEVPVTVGLTLSKTVKVELQVLVHPFAFVTVNVRVNAPQADPLNTDTVLLMVDPFIVPLPVMFHS
jgi:hypothetical protein